MRKLAIGGVTFGILVLVGAARVIELRASYSSTLNTAEARAANLALIIAEYVSGAFASNDAALRQLALHSQRIGGPTAPAADWGPSLTSARAGVTGIGAITVTDRAGIIRHSTQPAILGQSRAGDPAFQAAISSLGDDVIAGPPFFTRAANPAAPPVIIPIARRLTDTTGQTVGAIVASFVPADTRRFFSSIDIGAHGTISVFHPDGVVLFQEPSVADPIGRNAANHPLFVAGRGGQTGTLRAPVEENGPVLLSAYRTMKEPPLLVAVSLDRDEVLAAWYREARGSAVLFVILAGLLGALLAILYRQMNAMDDAFAREHDARREAEAASALKDQFLMTVSHELRTPLTAIGGWARMLRHGNLGGGQRDAAVRTIERNVQTQTRLIDDLLDMSRVASGRLTLTLRPLNIGDVVRNAVDSVRPAAEAKSIELQVAGDVAGRVNGDADRLHQVMSNLLSNAVKFTPEGGSIAVSAARAGRWIEIVVADTGCGISADFLPHVFERFRQEDEGTGRQFSGLGLGLAIVNGLVRMHGGSVAAHSDGPGRGSTFTVRLPLEAAPAAAEDGRHQASASAG